MNQGNKEYFSHSMPFWVLFALGIAIITHTFTPIDAEATTATQPVGNNTAIAAAHNVTTVDPSSEVASMTAAFGQPFYVLNNSRDTGNEVVDLDPQQTKDSYIAEGFMQGIGNVTEQGTYITTYSSPISSSVGKGFIVKGEQVATFTAEDIGSYDKEGNLLLKGAMFFQSDDKEMSNINGKVGLYIYWKSNNGTDWSKAWLWE